MSRLSPMVAMTSGSTPIWSSRVTRSFRTTTPSSSVETRMVASRRGGEGQPEDHPEEHHGERGQDHELALREVDRVRRLPQQHEADGGHGVDGADRDAGHQELEEVRHGGVAPARGHPRPGARASPAARGRPARARVATRPRATPAEELQAGYLQARLVYGPPSSPDLRHLRLLVLHLDDEARPVDVALVVHVDVHEEARLVGRREHVVVQAARGPWPGPRRPRARRPP